MECTFVKGVGREWGRRKGGRGKKREKKNSFFSFFFLLFLRGEAGKRNVNPGAFLPLWEPKGGEKKGREKGGRVERGGIASERSALLEGGGKRETNKQTNRGDLA